MNVLRTLQSVCSELQSKVRQLNVLLASENFRVESLGTISAEIATLKGKRDALDLITHYRHGSDNDPESGKDLDDSDIVDKLMDKVLRGADDSWSGRGNEIRRSHFDGFLSIAQDFRQHVRIQAEQNKIDAEIVKPADSK